MTVSLLPPEILLFALILFGGSFSWLRCRNKREHPPYPIAYQTLGWFANRRPTLPNGGVLLPVAQGSQPLKRLECTLCCAISRRATCGRVRGILRPRRVGERVARFFKYFKYFKYFRVPKPLLINSYSNYRATFPYR